MPASSNRASPRFAGQQRDDLDRGEDFVRRMIRLLPQRVPHALGTAQVLLPRFLERAVRPARPRAFARRRRRRRARPGRRRSPRTSGHRAIPAARLGSSVLVRRTVQMWAAIDDRAVNRRGIEAVRPCRHQSSVIASNIAARSNDSRANVADRLAELACTVRSDLASTARKAAPPRPGCSSSRPVPSSASRTAR